MSFFSNLFGGGGNNNPANAAMPYLNQIQNQSSPYLNPYSQWGQAALPWLGKENTELLTNPGGKLNDIGKSYQQSPGLEFAIQQAMGGAGRAAAAGGYAGSPEHEFQNMGIASNLANQDYNNWLGQATGMYNQGLAGTQGLASGGLQAGQHLSDMIAQQLASQAGYAYAGQAAQNQQSSGFLNNLLKAGGALSAFTPWGQAGGAVDTAFNRFYK